jgi:hypothetical protein
MADAEQKIIEKLITKSSATEIVVMARKEWGRKYVDI